MFTIITDSKKFKLHEIEFYKIELRNVDLLMRFLLIVVDAWLNKLECFSVTIIFNVAYYLLHLSCAPLVQSLALTEYIRLGWYAFKLQTR